LISINAQMAAYAHLRIMKPSHYGPDHSTYVWHLAAALIESHGETAPDEAIAKVEALCRNDEIAAARVWRDVMHACRALLSPAPSAGPH
jgi:hypothetical protein